MRKRNKSIVTHLTSVHAPFDDRIFLKECKSLCKAGYNVCLVAPDSEDKIVDGIKILSIPEETSRFRRFLLSPWRVFRRALESRAKICHFHDPELIPVGILLRLMGRKVIYDVHEDLPRQILTKRWISPWLRRTVAMMAEAVEWFAARFFFTSIVAATPTIANRFPPSKTITIYNYPSFSDLALDSLPPVSQRPREILYLGGITLERGIREIMQALSIVDEKKNVRLRLGAQFWPESLKTEISEMKGWEKVIFCGWMSREEVVSSLQRARAGLVVPHPTANYKEALPVKMFEYMAAGLPVIAADFPLWREVFGQHDCAIFVDSRDPEAIARAIEWIIEHPEEAEAMGRKGREAVKENYNWAIEEKKLIELYNNIIR